MLFLSKTEYELIIVGGGPAGMSAGIYGGRGGLKTLILESEAIGGNMSDAPEIDNYPAVENIKGMELAEKMKDHASKYADINEIEPVEDVSLNDSIEVETKEGAYSAEALVISTGTEYRKLGVPGEERLSGNGVSYCATCDGFFYKDKSVIVVGGGNSALADASHLLDLGVDVKVVHRRDELRAEKALQESFFDKGGEVIWNSNVEEIKGEDKVEEVLLKNSADDSEETLEVDGVFIAIGDVPNTNLADKIGVETDERGFVKTDDKQRTNVPRIYAAGDATGEPKQVIVASAEGAKAAMAAYEDLENPYWT